MKITFNYKALFTGVALSLGLLSCSKNNEYKPIDISGLSLINALPSTEKLDVYINNSRATTTDFPFGTKLDYLNVYSGTRTIAVTKQGSNVKLKTEDFVFESQAGYSLFVINKLDDAKFLLIKDNLAAPAAGKAKIRFVNLSPDAEPLSFAVNANANLFTNKAFKEYTAFEEIDAAEKVTFNIKINADVVAKIQDTKIEAGKIYTIYAKGLKANSSDETKLSASIFTHK